MAVLCVSGYRPEVSVITGTQETQTSKKFTRNSLTFMTVSPLKFRVSTCKQIQVLEVHWRVARINIDI